MFLVKENLVELHNRNLAQLHLRLKNVHHFFLGNKSHISFFRFSLDFSLRGQEGLFKIFYKLYYLLLMMMNQKRSNTR